VAPPAIPAAVTPIVQEVSSAITTATEPSEPEGPTAEPAERQPDLDLDELAKRLYDRVHRQLKSELVIERERFGLIADLR
jgi:hypothetical protein